MLPEDIPCISHKDHVTNKEVRAKIQQAVGPYEDPLTIVKRRKLQWYGHVSHSSGLAKTILQGTVKGGRRQGRQEEVGRQHQGMDRRGVHQVPEGSGEQGKMEEIGYKIICGAPMTLASIIKTGTSALSEVGSPSLVKFHIHYQNRNTCLK